MPDENRFAGLSDAVEANDDSDDRGDDAEHSRDSSSSDSRPADDPDEEASHRNSLEIGNSGNIVNGEDAPRDPVDADASFDASDTTAVEETRTRDGMDRSDTVRGSDGSGISESVDSANSSNSTQSSNIATDPDGAIETDTTDERRGRDTDVPSSIDDPAFEFDDTEQHSVYVRPEVWQQFQDAKALVDARLRTEHDVRDLTGREFQDAVLRIAANREDDLVAAIVDARTE